MLSLLVAAFAQAGGVIFNRVGLADNHINAKGYTAGSFLFLSFFSIVTYLLLGWIDGYGIYVTLHTLALFTTLILIGALSHLLYIEGVKNKTVSALETIVILSPLLTVLFASLFHVESFDSRILLAVSTGTAALLWAAREGRHRVQFTRATWLLIGSMILSAFENLIVVQILATESFSPLSLYTFRTTVICILFLLLFYPKLARMKLYNFWFVCGAALFGFLAMLFRFYALRDLGIIHTSIILMLVPVLVYLLSFGLLQRKLRKKQNMASLCVLAIAIYLFVLTK